ncbi:hypothetical protein N9H56_01520 [Pseudomonadales bacterium]|nr:hypothetical protein [Pseudomonadales bacterium]
MKNCLSEGSHLLLGSSIVFALTLLSGCSFHSNQWTIIKNLLEGPQVVLPSPWRLSLGDNDIAVYPVQVDTSILFTDGRGILVNFDGWHIIETRGLGQSNSESSPRHTKVAIFDYKAVEKSAEGKRSDPAADIAEVSVASKNTIVYHVRCSEWQRSLNFFGELLTQSCAFEDDVGFSNRIQLDQSGNIVALTTAAGSDGLKLRLVASDHEG